MKTKSILKAMLLFGIIFIFHFNVLCDTTLPPCSYNVLSQNKKFLFIMLVPKDKIEVECIGATPEKSKVAKLLRKKYSKSGLYKTGVLSPMWEVDWYSDQVFVSNNGEQVIRIGPWASNLSDEAFTFIKNGEILKRYTVGDLIRSVDALPHSTSHFEWRKELELDEKTNSFLVTTLEDNQFSFDITTGIMTNSPTKISEKQVADSDSSNSYSPKSSDNTSSDKNDKTFCGGIVLLFGLILSILFEY